MRSPSLRTAVLAELLAVSVALGSTFPKELTGTVTIWIGGIGGFVLLLIVTACTSQTPPAAGTRQTPQ